MIAGFNALVRGDVLFSLEKIEPFLGISTPYDPTQHYYCKSALNNVRTIWHLCLGVLVDPLLNIDSRALWFELRYATRSWQSWAILPSCGHLLTRVTILADALAHIRHVRNHADSLQLPGPPLSEARATG